MTGEMRALLSDLVNEKLRDFEKINSRLLSHRTQLLEETLLALSEDQHPDSIKPIEVVLFLLLLGLFAFMVIQCPR